MVQVKVTIIQIKSQKRIVREGTKTTALHKTKVFLLKQPVQDGGWKKSLLRGMGPDGLLFDFGFSIGEIQFEMLRYAYLRHRFLFGFHSAVMDGLSTSNIHW